MSEEVSKAGGAVTAVAEEPEGPLKTSRVAQEAPADNINTMRMNDKAKREKEQRAREEAAAMSAKRRFLGTAEPAGCRVGRDHRQVGGGQPQPGVHVCLLGPLQVIDGEEVAVPPLRRPLPAAAYACRQLRFCRGGRGGVSGGQTKQGLASLERPGEAGRAGGSSGKFLRVPGRRTCLAEARV